MMSLAEIVACQQKLREWMMGGVHRDRSSQPAVVAACLEVYVTLVSARFLMGGCPRDANQLRALVIKEFGEAVLSYIPVVIECAVQADTLQAARRR